MSKIHKVPFSPPEITEEDIASVSEVMRSGWITTGPRTKEFERQIALRCGTSRAVCLNSATAALELTLRILGVGPGDEVIVPVYTYTASASPVLHVGAKVVFVDVNSDDYSIDCEALASAITCRTKAVVSVDIGGRMCNYPAILKVVEAGRHLYQARNRLQEAFGRIVIIADGAHSFGASRGGVMSGNGADFTTFSFHAVKNLTTAEGGAATWRCIPGVSDDEIYSQYMLLSLHGQNKDALAKIQLGSWEYDIVSPAYKCNMTDIAAALGLSQLGRYDDMLTRRKATILEYDRHLKEFGIVGIDHYQGDSRSSGHLYLATLPEKLNLGRDEFIMRLAERGVACNVHYKPLAMMTAYMRLGYHIDSFPKALSLFQREVSLPLHSKMTDSDVSYVLDSVGAVLYQARRR